MYRGWQVPDGVVLCLNGHSITATGRNLSNDIFVTSNTTFTMTDCQNTGRVTHAKNADGITYTGSAINVSGEPSRCMAVQLLETMLQVIIHLMVEIVVAACIYLELLRCMGLDYQ